MSENRSLPSWVWLLFAAALLAFAIVWSSRGEDADEENPKPSLQNTGRMPVPPGGDFSGARPDRPIERRERTLPGTFPHQRSEPAEGRTPAPAAP